MIFRLFSSLLLCLALAGNNAFAREQSLTDITGHLPDLQFSLTDDAGRPVTEQDYSGDVVLLYFGFTGCSTQCPITMAQLTSLFTQAGKDAAQLHLLFASVNPENDTPRVLHRYIASFDPQHMSGLTGKNAAIEALARRYRAAYRPDSNGQIAHSNVIYIFDTHGRARLLATPADSNEELIAGVKGLLHEQ